MITGIVAHDDLYGIGVNNTLPWHHPDDLKHFKESTLGKYCVMGRKTWESLPNKSLPNRKIIVISRDESPIYNNGCFFFTLENFISCLSITNHLDYVVCGGSSIYTQLNPFIDRWIVSEISGDYSCDTRISPSLFNNHVESSYIKKSPSWGIRTLIRLQ